MIILSRMHDILLYSSSILYFRVKSESWQQFLLCWFKNVVETLALMRDVAVRDQALLQTLLDQRDQLVALLGSLRGMLNSVSNITSGLQGCLGYKII